MSGLDVQGELNRIAGTTGVGPALCANIIASDTVPGTTGYDVIGALNIAAGTSGLDLQGVANALAGTTGLGVVAALALVPPI